MRMMMLWAVLCCALPAAAQGGGAPGRSSTPTGGAQAAPAAPSQPDAMRSQMMMRMEQQSEQEMRADLDLMKRKVELMRSEALSIADSHARDAINTNADLWQQLIAGMEKHVDRMQQMQRMQSPGDAPPENAH